MTNQSSPLPVPRRSSQDANWAKKIEIAKQAREAGQNVREKGQPPAVSPSPDPKNVVRK